MPGFVNNHITKDGWLRLWDLLRQGKVGSAAGASWDVYLSDTVVDDAYDAWEKTLTDFPPVSNDASITVIDTPAIEAESGEIVILQLVPTYLHGSDSTPVTAYSACLAGYNSNGYTDRELIAVFELDPPVTITDTAGVSVWLQLGTGRCICE